MTPDEIKQARVWATRWLGERGDAIGDPISGMARAVLTACTEVERLQGVIGVLVNTPQDLPKRQPEPVSREEIAHRLEGVSAVSYTQVCDLVDWLDAWYTVTRKAAA